MNSKKILIIDDTKAGRVLLRDLIESQEKGIGQYLPYELFEAESGKEALEILEKTKQSLILMDINMPQLDGLETTRRIRKQKINTPIIAVTAQAMPGDKEECLKAGCTEYISKPFSIQDMITLIFKHLGVPTHEKHRIH